MKPKKLLSFLLATAMTISLLPTFTLTASAATTTEKNITLDASALKGGQASNVYFGNYQQSSLGNTKPTEGTEGVDWIQNSNGQINGQGAYYSKDPIKWRVLSNDGSKLFLLSDKNLDVARYHEDYEAVTWATSTIRSWLNGYGASSNTGGGEEVSGIDYSNDNFIGSAFSKNEQNAIATTKVINATYDGTSGTAPNSYYTSTPGGIDTDDKVFLLSIAEAQNTAYGFTDNIRLTYTREAASTDYVYGGGKTGATAMSEFGVANYWRLRSPGDNAKKAAIVDNYGEVIRRGHFVNYNYVPVRPAFNLNPASVLFTSVANGGKQINAGTLNKNDDYVPATNEKYEYKLTLLDSDRNFTVSDKSAKSVKAGDTISLEYKLEYKEAKTGDNEYVSAMIVNDKNEVLYYGQLEKAESGTIVIDDFTVPQDIPNGKYTLNLFNEQINGDKKTDFSSEFQTITLNVKGMLKVSDFSFTAPTDLTYDGSAKVATVTSDKDGIGEITVKYYQGTTEVLPKNVGTYTIKIDVAEDDNYFAKTDLTDENWKFTITPKDITNADITIGNSLAYNGTEQTQTISEVKVDDLTLIKDTDYTVSDNTGTEIKSDYVLTITGKGNFTGTATKQFSIAKATPTENPEKKTTARVKRGKTLAEATVTEGEMLGLNDIVLEGTFAWVDDTTEPINADCTKQMIFTPTDTNYAPITVDVAVDTYSSSGGSSVTRYTVKFNTNGGSTITSQTVTKNGTATKPTAPAKEGYIFDGWYTDSNFANKYNFNAKVTKNITLYAKWAEDEIQEPSDDKKDDEQKPTTDEWKNPFTDVAKADWFFDNVRYANENGLMSGTTDTTFAPNDNLTRGMLVTVLYRADGEPAVNKSIPFADVNASQYYANAVIWAEQNGIVKGVSETEFAPDENITREQIAAMMFRYAEYKGIAPTEAWAIKLDYADVADISDYAVEGVMYCTMKNIMQGKDNNMFAPKDNATRAEIAAILNRFIEGNK